ncbi:FAD-dependent oxidoreductase [Starkeya sp. ORNL1]|nr:FAD-dependent oxidoreductase [Starkeya sp. ORNL1]
MTSPTRLSRRAFLATASALAAPAIISPAFAQIAADTDVAIIGAGAAGIAAARRVAAAGRSHVLLEAAPRAGGRARTDEVFGMPFDLGANRFSSSEGLLAAVTDTGVETTDVPSSRRLYIGDREAKESQYEAFAAAIGRTERAIAATADAGRDIAARAALPESGEWGATVAAVLGPLGCGRDLANVSTVDLARRDVPPDDLSTALGVGSLLERVASLLNLRTKARVARVDNAGRFSTITLDGGAVVRARSVILAVPAAVIAAGAIRFNPALPGRFTNALLAYPAGQMEHVGFLLPNNPLGLSSDELVHVKAGSYPPAALYGRVNDTDLHVAVFGGAQASEIAGKGEAAAAALTSGFLREAFGATIGANVTKFVASRWSTDPLIRGAMAVGVPGEGALRRQFADPVGRMILAGEYVSPDKWGTLAGAWATGEVAAEKAITMVGGPV